MRRHCLIVTATTDKMISAGLSRFLCQAYIINNIKVGSWKYSTLILEDIKGYALMRNVAVKVARESGVDRLWFIDNDVVPADNAFDLMDTEADIAGAVVPYAHCMSGAFLKRGEPWGDMAPASGVHEVHGMGMACTWINREVFADGRLEVEPGCDPPASFEYRYKPNGETLMGEDFDFCDRATQHNYKVRLNADIICGHIKTVDLKEAIAFAQRRMAVA